MGMRKQSVFGLVALSMAAAVIGSPSVAAARDNPQQMMTSNIGSVRGTSFWDKNDNAKRDAGEPTIRGWFKVTDGGGWYSCGYTGDGDTFGVPVNDGTYYVVPVAPAGLKVTTPVKMAMVSGASASLGNDIGYNVDANSMGESCDQYSPARSYAPSIVEIAVGNSNFSTLVAAVSAAGLVDTLNGPGSFTVFAPTNAAFAKLPAGTVEALLKDIPTLTKILLYHVVPGKVLAKDVVTLTSAKTVEGSEIKIMVKDGKVYINDAQVVVTDIMANNGVVHVIDTVILPPGK